MSFEKTIPCIILLFFSLHGMDVQDKDARLFEKVKENLRHFQIFPENKQPSTWAQRRTHGYNGLLTPIVEYPRVYRSGFIIENAQPSLWCGFSYDSSCEPEDIIQIAQEGQDGYFDIQYQALIKARNHPASILSCCLFDDTYKYKQSYDPYHRSLSDGIYPWHLALLWQAVEQKEGAFPPFLKTYITMASLSEIKMAQDELDLDNNKIEIK